MPLSRQVEQVGVQHSIEEIAERTTAVFAFLRDDGLLLRERRILFPESFKGGFVLIFAGEGREITVEYLDMQFEVRAGSAEIFGPNTHPQFAGNVFSREHFLEHLSQLAVVVQMRLVSNT